MSENWKEKLSQLWNQVPPTEHSKPLQKPQNSSLSNRVTPQFLEMSKFERIKPLSQRDAVDPIKSQQEQEFAALLAERSAPSIRVRRLETEVVSLKAALANEKAQSSMGMHRLEVELLALKDQLAYEKSIRKGLKEENENLKEVVKQITSQQNISKSDAILENNNDNNLVGGNKFGINDATETDTSLNNVTVKLTSKDSQLVNNTTIDRPPSQTGLFESLYLKSKLDRDFIVNANVVVKMEIDESIKFNAIESIKSKIDGTRYHQTICASYRSADRIATEASKRLELLRDKAEKSRDLLIPNISHNPWHQEINSIESDCITLVNCIWQEVDSYKEHLDSFTNKFFDMFDFSEDEFNQLIKNPWEQ